MQRDPLRSDGGADRGAFVWLRPGSGQPGLTTEPILLAWHFWSRTLPETHVLIHTETNASSSRETSRVTFDTPQRRLQGRTVGPARPSAGFTLIELLIAVAVIGILAAIAIPNYTRYVKEARVADGKAKLLEVAGRLERCYTVTSDYTKTGDGSACVVFDVPSEEGFYTISPDAIGSVSTFAYKIKAEGSSDEVACTKLWVDQTGQRGSTPDGCW